MSPLRVAAAAEEGMEVEGEAMEADSEVGDFMEEAAGAEVDIVAVVGAEVMEAGCGPARSVPSRRLTHSAVVDLLTPERAWAMAAAMAMVTADTATGTAVTLAAAVTAAMVGGGGAVTGSVGVWVGVWGGDTRMILIMGTTIRTTTVVTIIPTLQPVMTMA